MYWMTHVDHGTMPAYDTSEKARLESCGWTLLNEGESPNHAPKVKPKPPESPQMAAINAALSRLSAALGEPELVIAEGQPAGAALIDLAASRLAEMKSPEPQEPSETLADGYESAPRRPGRPRKA